MAAEMTHDELRALMAEARKLHRLTIQDLADELHPFWSYCTCSQYLAPSFGGPGPSRIFLKLAGEALLRLMARKEAGKGVAA